MHDEGIPEVEEVQRRMLDLDRRDSRLWTIHAVLFVAAAAGLLLTGFSDIAWGQWFVRLDRRHVLFFGLVAVTILFNVLAAGERRILRVSRQGLIRQLLRYQNTQRPSLVDPVTEIFNRRYLDQILPKEVSRADRLGSSLSFLLIDIDGFKALNTRYGRIVGDRVLSSVAQLLLGIFRRSDTVIRYTADEFLIVLPETNEKQAGRAFERLLGKVDQWNRDNSLPGYKLGFSCGLATYNKGANVNLLLETLAQRAGIRQAGMAR
jgi:diguanylate cyclase (GGDEF)-like protein